MLPRPPGAPPRDESGFTLVEVIVSIVLIGIVMTSLVTFFVSSVTAVNNLASRQLGAQLADDASERVRALKSTQLVTGRDHQSVDAQWDSAVPAVAGYLSGTTRVWDGTAAYPSGATATLPTSPTQAIVVGGLTYWQNWYVGTCWQPKVSSGEVTCAATGTVRFFRVVVAVTWQDKHCAASTCAYVTSTLVNSASTDPVFNPNNTATAPLATNPGSQAGDVTVPASLQLGSTGGTPPVTWSGSGQPDGMTIASSGLITGRPTTAGTFLVTAVVTDHNGAADTITFTWTVNALPELTAPAALSSALGTAVATSIPLTGGTGPVTWAATGLPAGLAINAGTGAITGTPTTLGAYQTTVTVTDASAKAATATFTWTVPALSVLTPAAQTSAHNAAITPLQVTAAGGRSPYTWAATGLPPGLSIDSAGKISGTPTTAGSYAVTVTVTDADKTLASTDSFLWTVS